MVRITIPVLLVATVAASATASADIVATTTTTARTSRRNLRALTNDIDKEEVVAPRNLGSQSQDEQYQYDDYGGYDDGEDSNLWTETRDRIGSDLNNMWSVAPNQWSDEYFEVLGGIVAIALTAFAIILLICCAPCCSLVDDTPQNRHYGNNPTVKTVTSMTDASTGRLGPSQEEKQRQQGLLEGVPEDEQQQDAGAVGQRAAMPHGDKIESQRSVQDDDYYSERDAKARTSSSSRRRDPHRRSRRKQRKSLWTEVVSVWREFLTDSCAVEKENRQRHSSKRYYRYEDKDVSRGSFA